MQGMVATGGGVGVGGMAVRVGKGTVEVTVGERGVGLGGSEVDVGRNTAVVGLNGMGVGELGTARVHPAKSRNEMNSGTKNKPGFVLENANFINMEISFSGQVKSHYGIQRWIGYESHLIPFMWRCGVREVTFSKHAATEP